MARRKVPLQIQPGVIRITSEYAAPGRYIDMDKIRFDAGFPEKIKGWVATGWLEVTGAPRSALSWQSNDTNRYFATGSWLKLEVLDNDGDVLTDITPERDSGNLANPFTTVLDSAIVTVDDTSHGCEQGAFVTFSGASAVGGITIDGEYMITQIVDDDSYTITHSSPATSSAGPGGGASVAYVYAINNGQLHTVQGGGYGVGGYGEGMWGKETTGGNYTTFARRWSLDTYGEDLVAMPNNNGGLYIWDVSAGGRAALVANSPVGSYAFVTSERIIVVLGAGGSPMRIEGCDDDDPTDWTPTATNKSFGRTLQTGNRLVCGAQVAQGLNLLWTNSSVYLMQWANNNLRVYDTRVAGKGDDYGIIGQGAFTVVGGIAYWMSSTDFKMFGGATPARMPRADEIKHYVFDDINSTQAIKICCRYDPIHQEIWWHYPSSGSNENDRYVMYSIDEGVWVTGTLSRSTFVNQVEQESLIYAFDTDGDSYQHEIGTSDNGSPLAWYLELGYSDIEGGNTKVDVFGYIPDWQRRTGDVTLTLTTKDYPEDSAATETVTSTIVENQGIDDFRLAGRQVKFRLAGGDVAASDFRLGRTRLEINEQGNRR